MKRIVLTGGGTAGHVTPNMALVPALEKEGDVYKRQVIKLRHKHYRQEVDYGRISDKSHHKKQQATDVETYIHS